MREEVVRIVRAGWLNVPPFPVLIPQGEGEPRHELEAEPRILRYEVTLLGTRDEP